MRLLVVMASVGLLSLALSGTALYGFCSDMSQGRAEDAVRFVERFLESAPDGFNIPPTRRT
ncbi:hypothetical protein [Oceanicaulis sp.]|jgi:hypothetical protein|uniref:hypothetical protein n=1 Tax=Oceanicaulis sp. TaxID=1924941 RepID=UPI003F721471